MAMNSGSQAIFMKVDISLIKNVDAICEEIQKREKKINVLFLTAGYMTLKGRNGESILPLSIVKAYHVVAF